MRNILSCAVMLFLFTGCVTVRERGDTSLPTWRTFHARFDRVWGVLVSEISSFAVIETIEKTKGLITTGPLKMSSGLMSEILLKLYAHRPSNILGTWDDGRAVLSFLVTIAGKPGKIASMENGPTIVKPASRRAILRGGRSVSSAGI
jgi:hypothetical protein